MIYSMDFRRKAMKIKEEEGLSQRQLAKRLRLSKETVERWTKSIERKIQIRRASKIDMKALAEDVKKYPDAYQKERAIRFGVTQQAIAKALERLGVRRKKNSITPKSGRKYKTYLS